MKRTPTLALLLLSAALVRPVHAQQRDPVAAEALFAAAQDDMDAGRIAEACPKFKESHRLDPAIGTVFNIADCSEKLGRVAEGWQRFREVADKLPPDDARRDIAIERAAALEPRLPRLRIVVRGALPAGTVVERDGVAFGAAGLGVALPIDPGSHTIVVRAPGHQLRSFSVEMVEKQTAELVIEPGEALPPPPPPVPPPAPPPPLVRPVPAPIPAPLPAPVKRNTAARDAGIGLLAVGTAVGIATTFVGAITLGANDELTLSCPDRICPDPRYLDTAETGQVTGPITTAGLIVFGLGITTGAILLGVGTSSDAPARTTLELGPGGATFRTRF